jgi:mono/diheme cytochrome c family protein
MSEPRSGAASWSAGARWIGAAGLACGTFLSVAACNAPLPEPDSPGARLYAARCNGCHRIYAPGSMTSEMWRFQVERMQGELVRRGLPALTPAERDAVLAYLQRHATGSTQPPR